MENAEELNSESQDKLQVYNYNSGGSGSFTLLRDIVQTSLGIISVHSRDFCFQKKNIVCLI